MPLRFCLNAVSRQVVSCYPDRNDIREPVALTLCFITIAIDVWSAGMILLFFLTGKFPLFHSSDDVEALMEIASVVGRRRMEKAATLHSTALLPRIL